MLFLDGSWRFLRTQDVFELDCFISKKLMGQRFSWRFKASLLGRSSKPQ